MSDLDIKEIRKKIGVSQEKLAEMLGVVRGTIRNWEAGAVIPQSKRLILTNLQKNNIEKTEKIKDPQPDEHPCEHSIAYNSLSQEIQLLRQRIADLERTIHDKEEIIRLLKQKL